MITENIDVENSQANGTVGKFRKIKLKNNINDIFKIKVDGFYVNCVDVTNVEYMILELKKDK